MPSERLHLRGLTEEIGGEIAKAVRLGLRDAAIRAHAHAVKTFASLSPEPTDTGQLRRSFRWRPDGDGFVVENEAPHAAFQEYGTRPGHQAPLAKLEAWANRKLRGRSAKPGEARRLAWATKQAIFKRGIKPKRFWQQASQAFPAIVQDAVTKRLKAVR